MRLTATSKRHSGLKHPPACLGTWIPLKNLFPCHWATCFCHDIVSDPSFCYVLLSQGFAAYKKRFGSWKGKLVSQCLPDEQQCAVLAELLSAVMPFSALFFFSQDAGGCCSHSKGHSCVLLWEWKHGVVPGCLEGLECQRLWRFLPGLRRAGKAWNLHAKKKVVLVVLGTEAWQKMEASCSEHAWTPWHSPGEGGDEGCVGGVCVWFAANERWWGSHGWSPIGAFGDWRNWCEQGRDEPGSWALSPLSCSITCSPAVVESRRWRWLQVCSCLCFQFLLPHFKFLPHLQHALAAAAAFIVYIVSRESSIDLSGLFPGSLSTL